MADALEAMYQEVILDHYKNPRGRGLRDPFDTEVHHVNPTCGDEITLRVRLDGDRLADVSYDNVGCSISQASASVMNELVAGKPVEEALAVGEQFRRLLTDPDGAAAADEELADQLEDGIAFAGVAKFPARVKCALLAWMAMKDATAQALAGKDSAK